MNEAELVEALAAFARVVRESAKGLTSTITWYLYGVESDYTIVFGVNPGLDGKVETMDKTRPDWECYVLLQGAGALQGKMTGNGEQLKGKFTGHLEERRDMHFIHQLLPANISMLKSQCDFRHPALSARATLMESDPHRTSAILFYQEYLRSIYQSVSGNKALLSKHIEDFPGVADAAELIAKWEEIETKLKLEKRSCLFEIKNGQFHVYEKIGKKNRLVNGWLFGIENPEEKKSEEKPQQVSHYDKALEGAGFHTRMKLLQAEAELLIGEHSAETIALVANHKSGTLARILASIEAFSNANTRDFNEAQTLAMKNLADQWERIAAIAIRRPKILASFGIKSEELTTAAMRAQKLKRKLNL